MSHLRVKITEVPYPEGDLINLHGLGVSDAPFERTDPNWKEKALLVERISFLESVVKHDFSELQSKNKVIEQQTKRIRRLDIAVDVLGVASGAVFTFVAFLVVLWP